MQVEGHLSEALCDRFVCGLRDYITQQHLLTLVDLTFEKAVQTAQGNEMTEKTRDRIQIRSLSLT